MQKLFAAVVLAFVLFFTTQNGGVDARTPLVADRNLADIARAYIWPTRAKIVYNPISCRLMGANACQFVLDHERGHVAYHHTREINSRIAEMQADCFAAEISNPAQFAAGIRALRHEGHGDRMHGTGAQRVRRVIDAREKGRCHR